MRTYTIYVTEPGPADDEQTAEAVAANIELLTGYYATPLPPREKV